MSPFGGWYDEYYSVIYCPAIESAGMEPRRADDLYRPSVIVQDIWAYVKQARVLLADLTGKNANVFYELGLAHASDKPVVLLAQSMEDVPFDLRALRVITYNTDAPEWASTLRASITRALEEVLKAPDTAVLQPFKNPVTEAPPLKDERDRVVEQLMREVNVLRSEISELSAGRGIRRAIGPDEALSLIRNYVAHGMSSEMIVERIAPLGPPPSWIMRRVDEIQGAPKK
jgi:hypothetical protein